MLKILTAPNPILTNSTKKVDKVNKSVYNLVKKMEKVLLAQVDPQGVGLAATQVGVGISLFIMKASKNAKTEVFINPKIVSVGNGLKPFPTHKTKLTSSKKKKKQPLEGCLSIPRIWSPVVRSEKIVIEYQDLTGSTHKKTFTGLKSVIAQHEMDHLVGVLFTQRALEQNSQLYEEKAGKLKKIEY